MNDNKVYMVRVQPDVYEQVKLLAEEEDRSINNMANLLLKQVLTTRTFPNDKLGTDLHPTTAARIDHPGKRGHENIHGTPCGDPTCKLHRPEPVVEEAEEAA